MVQRYLSRRASAKGKNTSMKRIFLLACLAEKNDQIVSFFPWIPASSQRSLAKWKIYFNIGLINTTPRHC